MGFSLLNLSKGLRSNTQYFIDLIFLAIIETIFIIFI